MRTIGVVTGGRSDYGGYLPILRKIQAEPEFRLHLIVAGMHLASEFGRTVETIEADGFEVGECVEMLLASDTPQGIAKSIGLGTIGFAQAYARFRPDILLVVGDRFEMHAAVVAALPFTIPVAHVHGGELTQGALDDALRHSITKLSHLHFVAMEEYGRRVIQMGEEPWRVVVCGAPSLDNLHTVTLLGREELTARYGLALNAAPLLVTYHPVTLEYEETERQVRALLSALRASGLPVVFTAPNADTNGRIIIGLIQDFVGSSPSAWLVPNLGTQAYWSLMRHAAAMVGNSSSGIVEAPSFGLPVVNIGSRQEGRVRAENVIDVGNDADEILEAIRLAGSPEFRARLRGLTNPYGDGRAAEMIVNRLRDIPLDRSLIVKRFMDWPVAAAQPV